VLIGQKSESFMTQNASFGLNHKPLFFRSRVNKNLTEIISVLSPYFLNFPPECCDFLSHLKLLVQSVLASLFQALLEQWHSLINHEFYHISSLSRLLL